ncbi:MAG: phage holin family protein [Patescibacteria group bacterium]
MKLILKLLISTLSVLVAAEILPGVSVEPLAISIIVAILLGVLNSTLRPILVLLTFPITLLTLGLFKFVVNALMVLLVDYLVAGFAVNSILTAILFSLIVSIVSSVLETLTD